MRDRNPPELPDGVEPTGHARRVQYAAHVCDHTIMTLPDEIADDLPAVEINEVEGPRILVRPFDEQRADVQLLKAHRIIERID